MKWHLYIYIYIERESEDFVSNSLISNIYPFGSHRRVFSTFDQSFDFKIIAASPIFFFVYGSTREVCGRSLTAGKILFTGRQTCSLYLVL